MIGRFDLPDKKSRGNKKTSEQHVVAFQKLLETCEALIMVAYNRNVDSSWSLNRLYA